MAYAWGIKMQCKMESVRYATLESNVLADFWFPKAPRESLNAQCIETAILEQKTGLSPFRMAAFLDDGIALLQAHVNSDDVLFVLDANDLFTIALGLPHNKGDAAWYHWDRTTSDGVRPDPEQVLAQVTLVMKPKRSLNLDTGNAMNRTYFPAIKRDFERLGESKYWVLYSKRSRDNDR